jgi:hypothetical protein
MGGERSWIVNQSAMPMVSEDVCVLQRRISQVQEQVLKFIGVQQTSMVFKESFHTCWTQAEGERMEITDVGN